MAYFLVNFLLILNLNNKEFWSILMFFYDLSGNPQNIAVSLNISEKKVHNATEVKELNLHGGISSG